jgi:uncharacterized membrane protein
MPSLGFGPNFFLPDICSSRTSYDGDGRPRREVSDAPLESQIPPTMNEHRIHQIFIVSVLLKGAHALIECIGGVVLAVIGTRTIVALVNLLTQEELVEDPTDFVATHLRTIAQNFSVDSLHFYAIYLFSHGVVKIFLVIGLLRNKLWSYPASLIVLSLFIVYQVYRFSYTYSIGLIALSVLDLIVMGLICHEYGLARGIRIS